MTGPYLAAPIAAMVLLGIAAWCAGRLFRSRPSFPDNAILYFLLICLCLFGMRWPHISWPRELNMDESQLLAEGMRLLAHHVPWRDVDGTTSGPLNYAMLSVPMFFGVHPSWQNARLVLWASQCLTLIFLYLALRTFGSRAEAQFVLLPTIFFYAFAMYSDFTHYSSETLPSLLLAAGLYVLCKEWSMAEPSIPRLFTLGCLAGAIPFAKLQTLPLALFLIVVALVQAAFKYQAAGRLKADWWRGFGALCLGGLLVPALIMGVVIAAGAFNDFWKSYILASAAYTAQESFRTKLANVELVLTYESDFSEYFTSVMAALVLLLAIWYGRGGKLGRQLFWPFIVILVDGVLTLFCFFVAGKPFPHYAYLLVPPLGILFGLAFFGARKMLIYDQENQPAPPCGWMPIFLTCCVIVMGFQYSRMWTYLRDIHVYVATAKDSAPSPVAENILSVRQPGDTMSVWGWMPSFYVETGILPATRDTICHYIISPGPYHDYFRARYLKDFQQNPPTIFVDAIAGGMWRWTWTDQETHETFPELTQFLDKNYSLWLTIRLTNSVKVGSPIRLYLLKERMTARQLSPTEITLPARPTDWAL